MSGPNPSAANVGNVLTSQAVLFDKELIPNLKGETDGFVAWAERRVQPLHMGINRTFFQYNTLTGSTAQVADGTVGSPEFVGQISSPAQVGELKSVLFTLNLTISVDLWYTNKSKSDNTEERLV
jgi:hypothetical protein